MESLNSILRVDIFVQGGPQKANLLIYPKENNYFSMHIELLSHNKVVEVTNLLAT